MTFQVAANGSSVQTATGPQSLLNDAWPLTKLDTTKNESFQTISILFNREPHQPDPVMRYSTTLLYQFPHGYSYTPSVWMEWQNLAPSHPATPPAGGHATTFFDFGDDSASENIPTFGNTTGLALYASILYNADPTYGTAGSTAFLYVRADDTNVSIYLAKVSGPSAGPPAPIFIIGTTASVRLYVFAEPASILPKTETTMSEIIYKFNVYRNAALTYGAGPIIFDSVMADTSSNFDTSTGTFIVPVTGFYSLGTTIGYQWTASGGRALGASITNGGTILATADIVGTYGNNYGQWNSQVIWSGPLTKGDTIQVVSYGGGGLNCLTGESNTVFWGYFVSI